MTDFPNLSPAEAQDLLRELRRLTLLAGPLEQFLEIRADGMLSQRLEEIGNDLKLLWSQIQAHTDLAEEFLGMLETREEMLTRMDAMDRKLDRLLQLQERMFRQRQ